MRNGLKNCTFLIDRQCIKRCFFKKLDFLNSINNLEQKEYILNPQVPTIAHVWCDGHSTSTKFLWSERQELRLKVSRKEFYTYIHLDYIRVEFLFCIKKKNNNNNNKGNYYMIFNNVYKFKRVSH